MRSFYFGTPGFTTMTQPPHSTPIDPHETFAVWATLLPRLTVAERQQLHREMKRRIWHTRLQAVCRIPAPLKLGGFYSLVVLLAMIVVPLPANNPLFVPLLIAACGSVAVTLVAVTDMVLGLLIQRLLPQVPAFVLPPVPDLSAELPLPPTNSDLEP
jgi:hypothetical protein